MSTKKSNNIDVEFDPEIQPGEMRILDTVEGVYIHIDDLMNLADSIAQQYPEFKDDAEGMKRILNNMDLPETTPEGVPLN